MRNRHSPNDHDLGENSSYGGSRQDVDQSFSLGSPNTSYQCSSCGQPPTVKLVALKPELNTEELRKYGYMCSNCAHLMDKTDYRLQSM